MSTDYGMEGRGFVVPVPIEDRTTELPTAPREPLAVTVSSEESEAEALVTELSARMQGVRILAPSRADEAARAALREELSRMVATAQQLDAHLCEPERAQADSEHDEAFQEWATGGEDQ